LYTATESIFFALSCPTIYSSKKLLISLGEGTFFKSNGLPSFFLLSNIMSLQTLMHSSHIQTPGPATYILHLDFYHKTNILPFFKSPLYSYYTVVTQLPCLPVYQLILINQFTDSPIDQLTSR